MLRIQVKHLTILARLNGYMYSLRLTARALGNAKTRIPWRTKISKNILMDLGFFGTNSLNGYV